MKLLDNLNMYLEIIVYLIMGIAVIGLGIWFYLRSNKNAKQKEDNTDYSVIPKKPSSDLVYIDNVIGNMYVMDKGTRFVAAVKCKGFDYKTARIEEKMMIQGNYINLFNMIDYNLQFYIQCRDIDVENIVNHHLNAKQSIIDELQKFNEELNNLSETKLELANKKKDDSAILKYLDETNSRIKIVKRTIDNLAWDYRHIEELIAYILTISENKEEPQRDDYYIFSYKFNPLAFSVNLTKGEIEDRAAKELLTKANNITSVLKQCNVSAELVQHDELIEMLRRHNNPFSSNIFKTKDINNSNYYDMITTSDYFDMTKEEYVIDKSLNKINEELVNQDNVRKEGV